MQLDASLHDILQSLLAASSLQEVHRHDECHSQGVVEMESMQTSGMPLLMRLRTQAIPHELLGSAPPAMFPVDALFYSVFGEEQTGFADAKLHPPARRRRRFQRPVSERSSFADFHAVE